jgi:hypothetical protein
MFVMCMEGRFVSRQVRGSQLERPGPWDGRMDGWMNKGRALLRHLLCCTRGRGKGERMQTKHRAL